MWPQNTTLNYEQIFGNNVKACREAAGLTQKELAEDILGVPEELIQQIEAGTACDCRIGTYIFLANYFRVPLESLLTYRYLIPPTKNDTAVKE